MPQEADGSGLISLVWMACIYWNIHWWLQHLASLERTRDEQQTGDCSLAGLSAVPQDCDALITEILLRDGSTTIDEFLAARLAAYEAVVLAFDAGDRETLRRLVSSDVYEAFCAEAALRESEDRTIETVFSQLERPDIVAGLIEDARMEVSIRFAAEFFILPRKAAYRPGEGTSHLHRASEIWTFERLSSSRDKLWRVIATEADA